MRPLLVLFHYQEEGDAELYADFYFRSIADAHCNIDRNRIRHQDRDRDANSDIHRNLDADADPDSDADDDRHFDRDSHTHFHADGLSHSNVDPDGDSSIDHDQRRSGSGFYQRQRRDSQFTGGSSARRAGVAGGSLYPESYAGPDCYPEREPNSYAESDCYPEPNCNADARDDQPPALPD